MSAVPRDAQHNWPSVLISDFAKTSAGGTPKKSNKQFYDGGDIPWLMSGEVANRDITNSAHFLTTLGLANSSAKIFPTGSVLVAMYGATAGEVGILRFEATTNQAVCAIYPSERHVPEYLYYYLLHVKPNLVAQAVGNAQPNISQAKIKATVVSLPPLKEQKRIVAMLDQAFAALDRARAHAEANLASLKELILSASRKTFDGLAADWRSLGSQCEIYQPKTISAKEMVPDGAYEVYGANGRIGRYHSYNHEARQLLVTCRGATCGQINISEPFSWITGNAMIVRPKTEDLSSDFLEHFFRAAVDWSDVITGAAQPQITRQSLSPLLVPVPSRSMQAYASKRLSCLRDHVKSLEPGYQSKLADIAAIRQSLLQKAFAGELT